MCGCVGLCALVLVCIRVCCFDLSAVVCACISLCALVLFCVRLCLFMFTNNINIRFVFGCIRFVCVLQVLDGPAHYKQNLLVMALASVCGLSDHSQRATHYKIHCDDENDAHFQNVLNTEGSFALPRGQHVRS